MKILITGANGYLGSYVFPHLNKKYKVLGIDQNFFYDDLLPGNSTIYPNIKQGDIRDMTIKDFLGFDQVIHLAAVSNDPVGNIFASATFDINLKGTIKIAELAKKAGVKHFIFASSASVYGDLTNICTEIGATRPLTVYAESKLLAENELEKLSSQEFNVTIFRFATACGPSPRIRLDLVFNDFVYGAAIEKEIVLKSDGMANRPFICTNDILSSLIWALENRINLNSDFELINMGRNDWNFSIIDLANKISAAFSDVKIRREESIKDNRSYNLDFSKSVRYKILEHNMVIFEVIGEMLDQIKPNFEYDKSKYFRLSKLQTLISNKIISEDLKYH
jgi:nucleoside-diphosphate-sugar epimerase